MLGKIGMLGICLCTQWRENSDAEYVGYKGYKIIGCDPNDQIVSESASLKNSITKLLVN